MAVTTLVGSREWYYEVHMLETDVAVQSLV